MFSGIGLCDGSPGLSVGGPPGVTMSEHACVKPSMLPSQSSSRPLHASDVGVGAVQPWNMPLVHTSVPAHVPTPGTVFAQSRTIGVHTHEPAPQSFPTPSQRIVLSFEQRHV